MKASSQTSIYKEIKKKKLFTFIIYEEGKPHFIEI